MRQEVTVERAPDLQRVFEDYFEAGAAGTVDAWAEEHVVDGDPLRLVGTDEGEVFAGGDAYAYMTADAAHASGAVTVTLGQSEAHREGTVGWAYVEAAVAIDGEVAYEPRCTAVFVERASGWVLQQLHVSRGYLVSEASGG